MPKVAFVGASLTEGVYGGSYVNAVKKRLPDWEFINAGVGGSTINKLQERIESVLEQQPDAMFVLSGSNDAIAYSNPKVRSYYRQVQDLLPDGYITPDEFGAHFRDLLTEIQLAHVQVLVGLPPLEYSPAVVNASKAFNTQIAEIAKSLNVPVLDLHSHFVPDDIPERPELNMSYILTIGERVKEGWSDYEAGQKKGNYTYTFDGIHFTPQSAEKAADLIVPFLREHVI